MHHAVNFILFLFSCEAFAMDQCKKWEAGVVVVSSRTSDRSTAPQSLYNLRILKRFSVVPRMKEASAPGPAPQRCRRPWQGIIRHKPHLSCSVLEWRPECSDILNLMLLLLHSFTGSLPFAQVHILSSLGSMMGFSGSWQMCSYARGVQGVGISHTLMLYRLSLHLPCAFSIIYQVLRIRSFKVDLQLTGSCGVQMFALWCLI